VHANSETDEVGRDKIREKLEEKKKIDEGGREKRKWREMGGNVTIIPYNKNLH